MKHFKLILFLLVLFPTLNANATVFNYSAVGLGLIQTAPQTPYQSTNVWGNIQISDVVGHNGYGGGPSFQITGFQLFFDGGQSFSGTGNFLFSDLTNSSWISTWILQGTGNWSYWYGDSGGQTPLFYHDNGTTYSPGAEYNVLASRIDLGNLFNTWDINGNQQFPGNFLLDTKFNALHKLSLTRTGVAPVSEPATVILLGCGLLLAVGLRRIAILRA